MNILTFTVAGSRFGIPSKDVREAVRAVSILPLPDAPAAVEGVIAVRGEVVPLFDLRTRFGLPPRPLDPEEQFVLAEVSGRAVGFRTDRVTDLLEIPDGDVTSELALPLGNRVSGVARLPDGLVLLHDLGTFLSSAESSALDRALSPQRQGGY